MYKVQNTETGEVVKSYEIMDIYHYLIANPSEQIQFYIDYQPHTKPEFLKLFLQDCKDYNKYSRLYNAVIQEMLITDYAKNKREVQ
jgi:N6-adenosine-specific RNA methylase IME4